VLERARGLVFGVTGQVDLPVLPHQPPLAVHDDRRVVPAQARALAAQLRVAQTEREPQAPRLVEQCPGLGAGHLSLEEGVDLGLVLHPPAREERGQGQLRKHHEIRATTVRLIEQGQ
jgi:hypothetical protein